MKWQDRILNDLRRKYDRPNGRRGGEAPEFFIFVYALPDGSIQSRRTQHEIEVSKQILDTAWDTIRLAQEKKSIIVITSTGTPKEGEGVTYTKKEDDIPDFYVLGYVCPDGKLEVQYPDDKPEQCRKLLNAAWSQICQSAIAASRVPIRPGQIINRNGFLVNRRDS